MNIVVLDPAEEELFDFCDYYENQRLGLGDELLDEFLSSIERIRQFPRRYALYDKRHRLCPLHRFNIGIYYHVAADILVEALIDLRRSKRFVKRRLRF